jgi:hypothetical protein
MAPDDLYLGEHARSCREIVSWWVVAWASAVAAVSILAGCGGNSVISLDSAANAVRASGFRQVEVSRSVENDTVPGRGLVQVTIGVVRVGSRAWPRIELLDYRPSGAASTSGSAWAARVYPTTFGPAHFKWLVRYWKTGKRCKGCAGGPPKRPPGFSLKKILSVRVCNVIVWSYNSRLDPRLTARVKHAVAQLRARC